jgi:hypothetical protein
MGVGVDGDPSAHPALEARRGRAIVTQITDHADVVVPLTHPAAASAAVSALARSAEPLK